MEDNLSLPPHSNNSILCMKTHFKPLCDNAALNRPQKHPNMVPYGMFSQPYSLYPVQARA